LLQAAKFLPFRANLSSGAARYAHHDASIEASLTEAR
jgi:hypothetical protein